MAGLKKTTGLGRGLDALLGDFDAQARPEAEGVRELPIARLYPNPDQPRKAFDADRLAELAGSLRQHGMVQPIVARRTGDRYMIVTGERRYRAAQLAGMENVPVVVREIGTEQVMELALIENIQREDLNPIEEAAAISFLMEQHDLTQEEVAERLSKSRPAVANALRLLNLPEPVKKLVRTGALSAGHGRALAVLEDAALQERLARQAAENRCSVRAMEQMVKAAQGEETREKKPRKEKSVDPDLFDVESRMRERLGTKVRITGGKNRGRITIDYFSPDALQEIYEAIVGG